MGPIRRGRKKIAELALKRVRKKVPLEPPSNQTFSYRTPNPVQIPQPAPTPKTFEKRYRPTDWAHRHRLEDAQKKTEKVVSYTRRT